MADQYHIIVETKKLYQGLCPDALETAKGYASKYKNCKKLILTDGNIWKLYKRKNNRWVDFAYMDMFVLTDQYFNGIRGMKDFLNEICCHNA